MTLSGQARLAGVAGWPVAQSLSPRLHGYWLAEHRIDGAFLPLPVRREDFARAVCGLRAAGFAGLSVTIPHKQAAFALASTNDAPARATGAVNLLIFGADGATEGRNTDVEGLRTSLSEAGIAIRGKPAVVLGAGGAARAAVMALDGLGAAQIRVLNRHGARARLLAGEMAPHLGATPVALALADWDQAAADAAVVINATSAGMAGAAPLDLAPDALPQDAAVCDLVYNPLDTAFLKKARLRGLRTIDGLGMLMHQAVPAFAAFFGVEPRVTPELRSHLEKALNRG